MLIENADLNASDDYENGMNADSHLDHRWLCTTCGDLDYLNDEGLCRSCQPEPVVVEEFAVIAMRALTGERVERQARWRIS